MLLDIKGGKQYYRQGSGQPYDGRELFGSARISSLWRISEASWAKLGLRADSFGDMRQLGPAIAVVRRMQQSVFLSVSVESEFAVPALGALYASQDFVEVQPLLVPAKAPWVLGAELLSVSRSLDRFRAGVFYKSVEGLFSWEDFDGDRLWQPFNLGERTVLGVECSMEKRLGSVLGIGVEYTYTTWGEEDVSYVPQHLVNAHIDLTWILDVSGQLSSSSARLVPDTDEHDLYVLSPYTTIGVSVGKRWGGWEWSLEFSNLTNESYEYFAGIEQPPRSIGGSVVRFF
jgi:hypothetical protein